MKKLLHFSVIVLGFLYSVKLLAFDAGLSGYTVSVSSMQTKYQLMSFFVMPNESVAFEVKKGNNNIPFAIEGQRLLKSHSEKRFMWKAPADPGLYRIRVTPDARKASELLIFVMRPATQIKNGNLDNYTIGAYPSGRLNELDLYSAPKGFVKVTADMVSLKISPHYTLGQFLCKQKQPFPKYVVLRTQLLNKLELLTHAINDEGIATDGLVIMSGFRTPHYNKSIGSKTNSRHLWGGAADVFIDESPKDNLMDDLNKDGKINTDDAAFLAEIVEKLDRSLGDAYSGGLSLYSATASHGPFVHIDVRGFKARW